MPRRALYIGLMAVVAAVVLWLAWPSAEAPSIEPGRIVNGSGTTSEPRPATSETPGPVSGRPAAKVSEPVAEVPRPAMLSGRVMDAYGEPVPNARIELRDGERVIDTFTVGSDGTYTLIDEYQEAAMLTVGGEQRELAPLLPGEERALDIVLGETREVVGWVLDLAGDPVTGVAVTMRGEQAKSTWSAWTDARGEFRFRHAPPTVVRVTADAAELGMASQRVIGSVAPRREVTLVLEPTGTLIVHAKPTLRGEVIVRSFDPAIHGADALYLDEEPTPDRSDYDDAMVVITEALKSWDPARPEDSIVALAEKMAERDPRVMREMRRDALREDPNLAGSSFQDIARAGAKKVMREEPHMVAIMNEAARQVKAGKSFMDAIMAAQNVGQESAMPERYEAYDAEPPVAPELGEPGDPDFYVPEGELENEAEPIDGEGLGESEGELGYTPLDPEAIDAVPTEEAVVAEPSEDGIGEAEPYVEAEPYLEAEPYVDPLEEVRRLTGASQVEPLGEERAVVARGALGQEISLRGAFAYRVTIRFNDSAEIVCGDVTLAPGQVIELMCGQEGEVVVTGRLVDSAGRPLSGESVKMTGGMADDVRGTSDARGFFELTRVADQTQRVDVYVADGEEMPRASRQGVTAAPGHRTDLGTIIVRRPDEQPNMHPTEPFGGVGAALQRSDSGTTVTGIAAESPLGLAGVEDGAVLVTIDDIEALSLSEEDIVMMLRGDVGSEVALRLRAVDGELYDVLVERGLIDPRAAPPSSESDPDENLNWNYDR